MVVKISLCFMPEVLSFLLSCLGEGNGNPLQCSCLENPTDGRAWRGAICGVAQSWTRLKRLSSSSIIVLCFDACSLRPSDNKLKIWPFHCAWINISTRDVLYDVMAVS